MLCDIWMPTTIWHDHRACLSVYPNILATSYSILSIQRHADQINSTTYFFPCTDRYHLQPPTVSVSTIYTSIDLYYERDECFKKKNERDECAAGQKVPTPMATLQVAGLFARSHSRPAGKEATTAKCPACL